MKTALTGGVIFMGFLFLIFVSEALSDKRGSLLKQWLQGFWRLLSEFLFFCVIVGMCVLVIYLGYLFFVAGEDTSPHYGVVVGMYHNKTGYYLHYSDSGQLWKDKVSYASYITCHKGSVWDGVFQLVCTKNGVFK